VPAMKFTIHNTVDEQFYFNLKDVDGRKLLTSRNYPSMMDCSNEIYLMQQYHDFQVNDDPQLNMSSYRFSLSTNSGTVIAKSPKYFSLSQMKKDKAHIKTDLVKASVEDHSASVRFFRPVQLKR
jgi:uncharacterized protein YegP (UPF0339 family)